MTISKIPLGKFEILNDFRDHDHWHDAEEEAFYFSKEFLQSKKDKVKNDFLYTEYFNQLEVIQVEQFFFFNYLSKENTIFHMIYFLSHMKYLNRNKTTLLQFTNNILDYFYLLTETFFEVIREIIKALIAIKKTSSLDLSKIKVVCSGISPYAIPSKEKDLSFFWLTLNKITKESETLFLLPVSPNKKQTQQLLERKILFLTEREITTILSKTRRFTFLTQLFFLILKKLKDLASPNYQKRQIAILKIQALKWEAFFKKVKPAIYLTSLSTAWPSPPESLLKKQCNFKHVIWFYGTGEFHYSNKNPHFQDLSIRFSLFNADQAWLWNKNLADLFSRRKISDYKTEFIITGPIIYSKLIPHPLPSSKSTKVAIFDIPSIKPVDRVKLGIGPFTTFEIQNAFYTDLLKLIRNYPSITFIFKEKRRYQEKFELVDSFEEIKKLPNVELRDPLENPLQVIHDVNLSISTPFTSPSIYAETLGRAAIYYDPLNCAQYTADRAINEMTVSNFQDLDQKIKLLIKGELFPIKSFQKISPESTIKIIKEQIKNLSTK
ncbi:hypothetical protein [Halobacteriovorax sp. HLS]|uniref:hypothetical protein n=1 Tax=Halobacteriovorax sp. HLS TaxID=2234000 RepID=UPI000FD754B9|nr:hypothetical protein [Halobacteriovorax sp. HLS]